MALIWYECQSQAAGLNSVPLHLMFRDLGRSQVCVHQTGAEQTLPTSVGYHEALKGILPAEWHIPSSLRILLIIMVSVFSIN